MGILTLNREASNLQDSFSKNKKLQFDAYKFLVHQAIGEYRGLGTPCEKNDLLQEGYLCLWELIRQQDLYVDEFKALAITKLASRLRTVRRHQNRTRRLLPRLEILSSYLFQLSNDCHSFETIFDNIEAELENLSAKQKDSILRLFGLQGPQMSAEEIATQDGKSSRAVWGLRKRGLKTLRGSVNFAS